MFPGIVYRRLLTGESPDGSRNRPCRARRSTTRSGSPAPATPGRSPRCRGTASSRGSAGDGPRRGCWPASGIRRSTSPSPAKGPRARGLRHHGVRRRRGPPPPVRGASATPPHGGRRRPRALAGSHRPHRGGRTHPARSAGETIRRRGASTAPWATGKRGRSGGSTGAGRTPSPSPGICGPDETIPESRWGRGEADHEAQQAAHIPRRRVRRRPPGVRSCVLLQPDLADRGPAARPLPPSAVRAGDAADDRAAPLRLRARAHQGQGAGGVRTAQGRTSSGARPWTASSTGPPASASTTARRSTSKSSRAIPTTSPSTW